DCTRTPATLLVLFPSIFFARSGPHRAPPAFPTRRSSDLSQIVAQEPATKVIILTTFDLDEYAFAGLRAGASGFQLKDSEPGELVTAIRTVHSGEAVISPRITRRMLDLFADRLPSPDEDRSAGGAAEPAPDVLTERELEVLLAIADGLSNAEIAADLYVSEATVKTHVGKVLAKLGL